MLRQHWVILTPESDASYMLPTLLPKTMDLSSSSCRHRRLLFECMQFTMTMTMLPVGNFGHLRVGNLLHLVIHCCTDWLTLSDILLMRGLNLNTFNIHTRPPSKIVLYTVLVLQLNLNAGSPEISSTCIFPFHLLTSKISELNLTTRCTV